MKTDAYIRVVCDECEVEMEVELTATARGWDDRDVGRLLENDGWIVLGDKDICDECAMRVTQAG